MSMKNSNDTIGNRTRDLPTCSAGHRPTALPRAPKYNVEDLVLSEYIKSYLTANLSVV